MKLLKSRTLAALVLSFSLLTAQAAPVHDEKTLTGFATDASAMAEASVSTRTSSEEHGT